MAQHRDAAKERYWRRTVGEQRRSGQSIRGFCRGRGLAESAFYFWRGELARRDRPLPPRRRSRLPHAANRRGSTTGPRRISGGHAAAATLLPLTIFSKTGPSAPLEVMLPDGVVLRIQADAPRELLTWVLGILGLERARGDQRPC